MTENITPPVILVRPEWRHPPTRIEGDCACAQTDIVHPGPARIEQRTDALYRVAPGIDTIPLRNEWRIAFQPLSYSGPIVLNDSAHLLLSFFKKAHLLASAVPAFVDRWDCSLINSACQALRAVELLVPEDYMPARCSTKFATLTAWLHTTNACNLACSYCYIDKSAEPMTEETGRQAVDAVFRSALAGGFRAVKLKYAGGEATLNFRLVMLLHAYAQNLAQQYGLELWETVLSNGVALTRPMLDFLREEGIRLSISLDGVGETHDRQRAFVNGKGSFVHVQRGIDRALGHGVAAFLSITVTADSVDRLPEAVAFALDRDLPFNLNFYRDHTAITGPAALRADNERLVAGMRAAFALIEERLPQRRVIDSLVDRSAFHEPHEYACGAGHNYLVIDQKGGVSACQMEIERPLSDVLAADPLGEIRLHSGAWKNVSVTEKEGCRECDWRFWCAGGCSFLTQRVTGRTDIRSPYCDVYKVLYPDVLRLEGLRMLKWESVRH